MPQTSLLKWSWQSEHVQADIENGEFVSPESTLVLAAPSRAEFLKVGSAASATDGLPSAGGAGIPLFPMGLIQGISVNQQRTVSRFFEIGAKRSYFVPQRLFTSFNLNRVLFFGPSLLRLLYAVAPTEAIDKFGGVAFKDENGKQWGAPGSAPTTGARNYKTYTDFYDFFDSTQLQAGSGKSVGGVAALAGTTQVSQNRDLWLNLNSAIFGVPVGLVFLLKDGKGRPYGAFMLEDCFIESHSMALDASNIVIGEAVSGVCDMLRPIELTAASTT